MQCTAVLRLELRGSLPRIVPFSGLDFADFRPAPVASLPILYVMAGAVRAYGDRRKGCATAAVCGCGGRRTVATVPERLLRPPAISPESRRKAFVCPRLDLNQAHGLICIKWFDDNQ